jgi:serine/threonine protein kinase
MCYSYSSGTSSLPPPSFPALNYFDPKAVPCKARKAVLSSLPTLFQQSYIVESLIGWGANGVVVSAFISYMRVAIKIIYKTRPSTPIEITLLSSLSPHPNLITYLDSFEDDKAFYLVTEYLGPCLIPIADYMLVDGMFIGISSHTSDLEDKALNARDTIYQIVSALSYMHSSGFTHGDVKLANCLESSGRVVLVDFGFATSSYRSFYGSPAYAAPELLGSIVKGRPSGR